jgi:hypothetical protein
MRKRNPSQKTDHRRWSPCTAAFNVPGALFAAHHDSSPKSFADRLFKAGNQRKVIITAVTRKLVTVANALSKSRQKWAATPT